MIFEMGSNLLLFGIGAAFGSFLNLLALRYDPDRFLLTRSALWGRSACPHCRRPLRWFELVPLLNFLFLRGRCARCGRSLSLQYPLVEIAAGLIFVLVPRAVHSPFYEPFVFHLLAALWTAFFAGLLLMSLIDYRLKIIPNELNLALLLLGLAITLASAGPFAAGEASFLPSYAALFGLRENIWLNRLAGALFGSVFLGLLVYLTRGRGMGMGDVKLAFALGAAFGWPETVFVVFLGFVLGSVAGIFVLLRVRQFFRHTLPFGPFLALAALLVFLFGNDLLHWYFGLFP